MSTRRRIWPLWLLIGALAGAAAVLASTETSGAVYASGQPWWEADPEARPAAADPADRTFTPTQQERAEGVAALTRTDDGEFRGMIRWEREEVPVRLTTPADAAHLAMIDAALDWLRTATGVHFYRTEALGAPVTVTLGEEVQPSVTYQVEGREIRSAQVVFDPAWERHLWEELAHLAGPYGDHSTRPDSVFSEDQTALRPGPFDVWLINRLYAPEVLPDTAEELVGVG